VQTTLPLELWNRDAPQDPWSSENVATEDNANIIDNSGQRLLRTAATPKLSRQAFYCGASNAKTTDIVKSCTRDEILDLQAVRRQPLLSLTTVPPYFPLLLSPTTGVRQSRWFGFCTCQTFFCHDRTGHDYVLP
jgi:hypothetical protein